MTAKHNWLRGWQWDSRTYCIYLCRRVRSCKLALQHNKLTNRSGNVDTERKVENKGNWYRSVGNDDDNVNMMVGLVEARFMPCDQRHTWYVSKNKQHNPSTWYLILVYAKEDVQ